LGKRKRRDRKEQEQQQQQQQQNNHTSKNNDDYINNDNNETRMIRSSKRLSSKMSTSSFPSTDPSQLLICGLIQDDGQNGHDDHDDGAVATTATAATVTTTGCDDTQNNGNHVEEQPPPPTDPLPPMSLKLEDEVVCKGVQGLSANHYGLHCLIRQWVSISFTRRSYNLLSRASFLAARCGISMDEIFSNTSRYAKMTNSQPMDFLSQCILLPKQEQKVLGPARVDLRELPWDFLRAIRIDPRLDETVRHRWIFVRKTQYGKCGFYASPLFQQDFATLDEIEKTWIENTLEVKDLWLAKRQTVKVAEPFFNLLYLMKEPNSTVFVTKCTVMVRMKHTRKEVSIECHVSMKQVDLDTMYYMNEFVFPPTVNNNVHHSKEDLPGLVIMNNNNNNSSSSSKYERRFSDDSMGSFSLQKSPFLDTDDEIEYTDLTLTEEVEEWLDMITNIPAPSV
jgi:hypothetical protein